MQVNYLRASTIGTYKDCEWKFYLQYILGFPSKAGKKALLGTIAHHILEIFAKAKASGHTEYNTSKRTDIRYICRICWERYTKENPEFEYTDEDKIFVYNQVMSVVNSVYDPLKLEILRTEHQFEIDMVWPGFQIEKDSYMKLRGTIDLITKIDDETIEIVDYKTGQRTDWITGEEKDFYKFIADVQLRFYNLACSKLYEQYKHRLFTIIFTRDGGPFTVTFTEKELYDTIDQIRRIYWEICNNSNPKRLIDEKWDQIWKCNYVCDFGKMEGIYVSGNGEVITKSYKFDRKGKYPEKIFEDGQVYDLVNIERICDKYYKIFRENSAEKLQQIAIDEALKNKISRRNDYGSSKITKTEIRYDKH